MIKLRSGVLAVPGTSYRWKVGSIVVIIGILMSAMAVADSGNGGGWFSGLFSTGGSGLGSAPSALISQQDSVVAASINQQATDCANGAPGTIGDSIKTAMNVHGEMASATPSVESLFDVNSDCFSSIGQIFDLSFSIPSLASILAAAQEAVLKYAQKKVCTAVGKVSGLVTTPINKAITNINRLERFSDINGMANSAVGGVMTGIDPKLGSEYHQAVGGNYTANTNPFGSNQTTFDGNGGNGTSATLTNNTTQVNALIQQIANQQIKINQGHMGLQAAQNNYNSCSGGLEKDCSAAFGVLQQAQQALAGDQAAIILLQTQLSQVVTQSGAVVQPTAATTPVQSAQTATSTGGGSWWSSLFN